MPTLSDIRKQYPEATGMSDSELASLYNEYQLSNIRSKYAEASDLSDSDLASAATKFFGEDFLLKPSSRNILAKANDTVIEAGNAAAGLVKAGVDLFAPDSSASDAIGGFIKSGQESQSDWKKDERFRMQRDIQNAESELGKAGVYAKHAVFEDPLGTLGQVVGNVGPFGAFGKATQGLSAARQTAATMGLAGGLTAGEVRGNIFEKISRTPDDVLINESPEYAALREAGVSEQEAKSKLGASFLNNAPEILGAAAIGSLGGKYGLEGMVSGAGKSFGRLGNAVVGVIDEGSQGAVEQLASNIGVKRVLPSQSLTEDVAMNAVAEGILGVGGAVRGADPIMAPQPPAPTIQDITNAPTVDAALDAFSNVSADLPPIEIPATPIPEPISLDQQMLNEEAAQIDQTELLASLEARITSSGTLVLSGEGAAEAVQSIVPDSPIATGKNGTILVPARFAAPVMATIEQARGRLDVQAGSGDFNNLVRGNGNVTQSIEGSSQGASPVAVGGIGNDVAVPGEVSGQVGLGDLPVANTGETGGVVQPTAPVAATSTTIGDVVKSDSSLNKTASWVIRNKETGDVVMETFDQAKVNALNTEKYEAVPIQEYLGSINGTAPAQSQTAINPSSSASTPALNDANSANVSTKMINTREATITKRDDLVGAIMRVTGGSGISAGMAQTITGDKAGSANAKLRGLFTNAGTADLGDTAMLLRDEEGYDVRDGEHLAELIREQASGNPVYSMDRIQREASENAEKEYKASVNQRAAELGLKKVGGKRTLAMVEADISRVEAERNEMEARAERAAIQAASAADEAFVSDDAPMSEEDFRKYFAQFASVEYTQEDIDRAEEYRTNRENARTEAAAIAASEEQAQSRPGKRNQDGETQEGTRGTAEREVRADQIGSSFKGLTLDQYLQEEPGDRSKLNIVIEFGKKGGPVLKGPRYSHIENAVREGHRVVLTRSGPALVDKNMRGWDARDISPAGMRYANWLISQLEKQPSTVNATNQAENDFTLAGQTDAEIRAQEEARKASEAEAQKEAARLEREQSEAETREEIKRRSEAAADTFELGQDGMDNLSGQGGLRFSRVSDAPVGEELVVIHNLSAENLLYADEIGGIPVPSIGITKAASPFTGYGEITLIASNDMVDPKSGTPVFDRDAYTARFPKMNYKKVQSKKADAFYERMKPVVQYGEDGKSFMQQLWDAMTGSSASPDKVSSEFQRYISPRMMYAKEVLGKDIRVPMKIIEPEHPFTFEKTWIDFVKANKKDYNDDAFNKRAGLAARKAMSEYVESKMIDDEARNEKLRKMFAGYLNRYVGEDGAMNWNVLDKAYEQASMKGKKRIDGYELSNRVDKAVGRNDPAYLKWITAQTEGLFNAPTITMRGREVEPTLDNIVEAMTTGGVQGAENTMTFGVGKTAAMLGKRFKSIDEIKAARDQVVSSGRHDEMKKDSEKTVEAYRLKAVEFFTQKDWRGNIDTWAGMDSAMEALAKAGKMSLTDGQIKAALSSKGFRGVSQEVVDLARESIVAIRSAATDYFEAKPQRAVSLKEFKGAVVPKGTDPEVIAALERNGLAVVEYNSKKDSDRAEKVGKLSKTLNRTHKNVLFSKGQATEAAKAPSLTESDLLPQMAKAMGSETLAKVLLDSGWITLANTNAAFERLIATIRGATLFSMADKDTVAGTQAPTSAGDGSTGSATPPDGHIRLYSGSSEKITEIRNDGIFGGIFASADFDSAESHGLGKDRVTHFMDVPESAIAESRDLDTDQTEAILRKHLGEFSEDEYDDVYKAVVRDKGVFYLSLDDDRIMEIFRSTDMGEAGWEAQRIRGVLAKKLGYKAVEMQDEHGLSYLVLPGTKVFPNEPRASAGSDAKYSKQGQTLGATLPDGRIILNLDALTADNFAGVFKHEGFHSTIRELLGEAKYNQLMKQLDGQLKLAKGNTWVDQARAAVPANTKPEHVTEEIGAYAIEQVENGAKVPNFVQRWVADLLSTLRTAIIRFAKADSKLQGWAMQNLKPEDLARLAVAGLRAKAMGAMRGQMREAVAYSKTPMPDTIDVDGVERQTRNSNGQPIHPTEDGIRNFWRWYDGLQQQRLDRAGTESGRGAGAQGTDQRTAGREGYFFDAEGRPKVFYHGTNADIPAFDLDHKDKWDNGWLGRGVYLASDMELSNFYANQKGGQSNVMPLYAGVTNPYVFTLKEKQKLRNATAEEIKAITSRLQDNGYDGGVLEFGDGSLEVVAFNRNAVKSSTGNNGQFSPDNPDIRFSRASGNQQKPDLPADSLVRQFQRKAQDKLNRFTVIKEWLADNGVKLSEQGDVYKAEERMHSRFANKAQDFRDKLVKPLVEKVQKAGFTMEDVAQFLHANHAEMRNAQIAKVNQNKPDGGSGMTNAEAKKILAAAPAGLKKLALEFRAITEDTKKILLDAGVIDQDAVDAWEAAYGDTYVPLKGGPDEGKPQGNGKGLSLKHKQKRALGHEMREGGEWIIENILADHERALMAAEKNRVFHSLVKMALETSHLDLITINKPEKRQVLRNDTAYEVRKKGASVASFGSEAEAKQFIQYDAAVTKASRGDYSVSKTNDPSVVMMASPIPGPDEATGYIKGKLVRVQFNDPLLAEAYNNMGTEAMSMVFRAGRMLNGYFSKIYTGYNPEFIVTNIVRDFTTGLINITGEEGIVMAGKAVKNYAPRFMELFKYAVSGNETKWVKMYRADGGNTGAAYLSDLERLGSDIQTEFALYQGVMKNVASIADAQGVKGKAEAAWMAARAAGAKVFDKTLIWIDRLNQAGENAMRLAVYQSAIESGKSRAEAASLAKNVTVNFNRKGTLGQQANAMWLFYNAGVQGTTALAHAHFKGKHKYQAWGASSALIGLGYLATLLAAGDDEDEYEKLSEYERSRNILIKTEDGYAKIPMAYGYGFFWNLGRGMADAQRTGDVGKMPWHIASSFMGEFSPFGNAVSGNKPDATQAFLYSMPTVAQIVGAPVFNRSGMGGPMMPESAFQPNQPDNEKMWRGTRGTMADELASTLAEAGFEVSPETLKHYGRTFTGGAGNMVASTVDAGKLKAGGAELETKEMPFVRKFVTEPDVRGARARYYEAKSEAQAALDEFNRAKKARDFAKMDSVREEKGELITLAKMAQKRQNMITAQRDRIDAIRLEGKYTKAEERLIIKQMEKVEEQMYDDFMSIFKERMR